MVDVTDYIRKKYNLDPYSTEERDELVTANEQSKNPMLAALAGFGAGISGGDVGQAFGQATQAQQAGTTNALKSFDQNRANTIQGFEFDRSLSKAGREDRDDLAAQDKLARESDPASPESGLARDLATKMIPGRSFEGMNAKQINTLIPSLTKIYDIQQQRLNRQDSLQASRENREAQLASAQASRDTAQANRDVAREDRLALKDIRDEDKQMALRTPYGPALTPDDAKQLKEAHESKRKFDAQLGELIGLRKEYGGEVYNREAVARAKLLSKDLLLEYKNMAKLGVLSQADEAIINAIIPTDPLEFNPSAVAGQDPTLHRLVTFKEDSDRDFATRVSTRTRSGQPEVVGAPKPIRIKDPSGVIRTVPANQVNAAIAAGGTLVDNELAGRGQ